MDIGKQLDHIYQWFQHEFDNYKQCQDEKELQEKDGLHDCVFSIFKAANAPKVGTHLLLAKQGFRESGLVYRKRLYSFRINEKEGRVENDVYRLKDEAIFDQLDQDGPIEIDLDPTTNAEKVEGCCVLWEYRPDKNCFHGATEGGSFRFESTYFPGKTIMASSDLFLGPDYLWSQDRGVDLDGNKMYGFKSDEHHKYLHCTYYKGTVLSGEENKDFVIHNQGGVAKIELGDRKFDVKLAQSTDLESNATVLRLSVNNDHKEELIGMAISDPNSAVIGGLFDGGIEVRLTKQK